MKRSLFNPEVHSFPFDNFKSRHLLIPGYNCGGMCAVALRKFYDGVLIDCEAELGDFKSEISDAQTSIVFKDPTKESRWGETKHAIEKISERIDSGKPTLLYIDQEDWSLHNDHFAVAYAIGNRSNGIQKIFTYDPNFAYKRCYCKNPSSYYGDRGAWHNYNDGKKYVKKVNFQSYLLVDFKNEKVYKTDRNGKRIKILGFQKYGNIGGFTHEIDITHSCNLAVSSSNVATVLKNNSDEDIPAWSFEIKMSKDGSIASDLKLTLETYNRQVILYEKDNNLYLQELSDCFGSTNIRSHKEHNGPQFGKGFREKIYTLYVPFNDNTSSYFQLSLVSNHIEKSCSLEVNQPRINTFTAFANEVISRDRLSRGTASWENYANVFLVVQNLMKTNIVECERVPDNYKHQHPVNALYVKHTEGKSSLTECEYYFGYIKDEIIVELTQNGGYDEATVKMITKESGSEDIKEFSSNSITFNLPGGNQESYNRNEFRKFSFEIIGKDAYSGFKDSFLAFLQDRCIIVYDSLFHEPNIVATDFLRLLFDNPNITISLIKDYNNRLWQKKYKQELRKPYLRNEKGFNRHFMKELKKELEVYKNKKQLENEIFNYYKDIEKYYKRKMASICKIGGSVKDIKEQITVLKRELFVKLAEKVLSKSIINNITQNVLTRK